MKEDKKSLNIALNQERQKNKTKPPENESETPLNRDQLLGIMKEHKDDPETLFNVFEYMTKKAGKDIEKAAVDAHPQSFTENSSPPFKA